MALQKLEFGSTDPNIPMDNKCTDNELHFRMRGGRDDYDDEGDNMDKSDTISTASWRPRTATELERFDLGTNDIDGYEGDDGDDVDADAEEEPSQGDNGLTQTLEN